MTVLASHDESQLTDFHAKPDAHVQFVWVHAERPRFYPKRVSPKRTEIVTLYK